MLQQAFQAQGSEFTGNGQHFLPVATSIDPASKTIVSAPLSSQVLELTKPARNVKNRAAMLLAAAPQTREMS